MDLNDKWAHDRNMFAPYCSTHGHRLILGYESVVSISTSTPPRIVLRCYCGTLIEHDAKPASPVRVSAQALAAC
jgi:hypothetical protein